ncbi:MAG: DUF2304 family protein [Atribacterota bacterium]|nr:DUF2304 family protein [Atribacterota bacterium]
MLIQILIVTFALFIIIGTILGFKKGNVSRKSLIFWIILWLAISIIVLLPNTTNFFAKILGVSRGTDVAIYLSIILIFYLLFRIFLRLEKTEREITKIVKEIAIKSKESKNS